MCLNCGCGMPEEDHGNPKNITTKTLKEAGEANNQSLDQTKENLKKSLSSQQA